MDVGPLPYELRIGVTGHRNLPDPSGVARAVDSLLDRLQETFASAAESPYGPHGTARHLWRRVDDACKGALKALWWSLPRATHHVPPERRTPLQWVVFSPLAKGADQIVADAVLKRPRSRLEASTPFPIADYRRDFDTERDSVEFDRLIAQDAAPVELPNPYGRDEPGDSAAERERKRELRRDGYEQIGRHIVNYSEIMIAIWNGREAAGRGGTAEIVRYAVELRRIVIWIDSDNPARPPLLLVPSKTAADAGPAAEGSWFETRPLPQRARDLSPGFHQLAAYNRDVLQQPAAAEEKFKKRRAHLVDAARNSSMPVDLVRQAVDGLLPHYVRADQLAAHYQSIFVASALMIHGLAAFAVTVAVLQYLLWHDVLAIVTVEIAAMGFALFLQRVNQTQHWRDKWLNDRHLAEEVRLSLFTIFLGPIGDAAKGHEQALPFYPGPWPWISSAVAAIAQPVREQLAERPPVAGLRQWLVKVWLQDQADWHKGNAHRKEKKAHGLHRMGLAAFLVTLVMAILHACGVGHVSHGHPSPPAGAAEHAGQAPAAAGADGSRDQAAGHEGIVAHWARRVIPPPLWEPVGLGIVILAMILPAWGAAAHAFNTLRDYERIATRSAMMHEILSGIANRAASATTYEALAREVQQAVELMRTENEEWMASFRIGTDPQPV